MYRVRYFATLLHLVTEYRRRDKYEEEDEEFKIKFPGIIEKRKLCLLGLRCNWGRGYQGNVKITKFFLASHRYIIVNVISFSSGVVISIVSLLPDIFVRFFRNYRLSLCPNPRRSYNNSIELMKIYHKYNLVFLLCGALLSFIMMIELFWLFYYCLSYKL